MCRLLAYACKQPRAVEDLFKAGEFTTFAEMSRLHRDGWGMAWVAGEDDGSVAAGDEHDGAADEARFGSSPPVVVSGEGRLRLSRSVLPAYEDPAFTALAERRLGSAGFVHLRWATSGLAVAESNTHPFLSNRWAFCHQGSIPSPDRLETLLDRDRLSQRRGTTDSESYFLYVLQCVDSEGDLVAGIRRAVTDIADACGPASLNAMLLSSSDLVVVHGHAGLEAPRDDLLATVSRAEELPLDHLDHYFRLRYRRVDGDAGGDVVITSSGLAGDGWTDVPENSLLHVDLSTRALSFHAFETARPAVPRIGVG